MNYQATTLASTAPTIATNAVPSAEALLMLVKGDYAPIGAVAW
jgi:hypothetical protein